jgi:hypothetical protein
VVHGHDASHLKGLISRRDKKKKEGGQIPSFLSYLSLPRVLLLSLFVFPCLLVSLSLVLAGSWDSLVVEHSAVSHALDNTAVGSW